MSPAQREPCADLGRGVTQRVLHRGDEYDQEVFDLLASGRADDLAQTQTHALALLGQWGLQTLREKRTTTDKGKYRTRMTW